MDDNPNARHLNVIAPIVGALLGMTARGDAARIDFAQCMDELGYACGLLERDDDLLVCEPDLEGGGEVAPD